MIEKILSAGLDNSLAHSEVLRASFGGNVQHESAITEPGRISRRVDLLKVPQSARKLSALQWGQMPRWIGPARENVEFNDAFRPIIHFDFRYAPQAPFGCFI